MPERMTQERGESDSAYMARRLGAMLDDTGDSEWERPVLQSGCAFLLMLGPHPDHGFCWCQPRMAACVSGMPHEHPHHEDWLH